MREEAYDRETEYQSIRALMKASADEGGTASLLSAAIREELTERQRQMVGMYYLEQHTMRDIALTLGLNQSTVSRTLAAARRRLRRCLRYTSRALLRRDE
ncbi:MAG: sigma-70 family RNA polymerase sigma factor [Oscillospiraceae bacterium]|nr:sigma-70 family RNA polymerase sigma factor [Oscillospiraceae bacterium]